MSTARQIIKERQQQVAAAEKQLAFAARKLDELAAKAENKNGRPGLAALRMECAVWQELWEATNRRVYYGEKRETGFGEALAEIIAPYLTIPIMPAYFGGSPKRSIWREWLAKGLRKIRYKRTGQREMRELRELNERINRLMGTSDVLSERFCDLSKKIMENIGQRLEENKQRLEEEQKEMEKAKKELRKEWEQEMRNSCWT